MNDEILDENRMTDEEKITHVSMLSDEDTHAKYEKALRKANKNRLWSYSRVLQ